MNIENKLILAIKASVKSGEVLLNNYSDVKQFQLKSKIKRDVYTRVDLESENEIIKIISKNNKEKINILLEENGYLKFGNNKESVWLVDALDGTVNYIHKIPFFCTSIALKHRGLIKFGVIFNPLSNELYYSHTRNGVFKNSEKISIDNSILSKSLVAVSLSSKIKKKDNELKLFKKINALSQGALRTGSAGMNLAYFSEGKFSACLGFENKIWDVAAGLAMARQNGAEIFYKYKNYKKTIISFLVANKNNFKDLYSICRKLI
jgi:myo-inositol-1(or 4)-monophosphatase